MEINRYTKEVESIFGVRLNSNQSLQIKRLIYEITRTKKVRFSEVAEILKKELKGKKPQGKNKFYLLKQALIHLRFPLSSSKINIDTRDIFLNELKLPREQACHPDGEFIPKAVYIEKDAKGSYLENNIRKVYPDAKTYYIDRYSQFLKEFRLNSYNLKEPLLFIVKEKWDFLKKCPCTKNHIGCGYWIFNLGFGCPFDCSYCYLQQYQNFPGIILPSNLDDFFKRSDAFLERFNKPIRIGTGEFCDSLALDKLTSYSPKLIDYFSRKKVFFELKTKSNKIENILSKKPSRNIIISWSLNPRRIIDEEECGTAALQERLDAARAIQEAGFKPAFHFDPIIYYQKWRNEYKELVENLYSEVRPPFSWISLGTLRFNRELKSIMEKRFPKSTIPYGELFIGEDKKLRYPEFLRIDIYENMVKWIRKNDKRTPIYLCMESGKVWSNSLKQVKSSREVERFLISGIK